MPGGGLARHEPAFGTCDLAVASGRPSPTRIWSGPWTMPCTRPWRHARTARHRQGATGCQRVTLSGSFGSHAELPDRRRLNAASEDDTAGGQCTSWPNRYEICHSVEANHVGLAQPQVHSRQAGPALSCDSSVSIRSAAVILK
jgi:hypothetical protein